ncbi:DUF4232 domain-containing protein [Goodfellowiella coeruleoviolacea]|uniref:DUF4232 domain-containing protein n=1 Tax=Goodfellowiella coeruleoviolacea TaxID=334858 RepID=A0AAE3GKQ4_9PSEU|nr:DUF4232 domain-containing protein [Goodfellowiella coeruleoviolacea]MCP2169169.1 Protein of unknown function (DUF4232) [Goodfellowiella coeruleoviolacea]
MVLAGNRIACGVLAVVAGAALAACGARPDTAAQGLTTSAGSASSGTVTAQSPTTGETTPAGSDAVTQQVPVQPTIVLSATQQQRPQQQDSGGTPRCSASTLTAKVTNEDAAAGNRYARLEVTNVSKTGCTLYGYGGMQLLTSDNQPVPTNMQRVANPGPSLVALEPGATAVANLHWTAVPSGDEPDTAACEPEATKAIAIPPDETEPMTFTWNLGPVCDHGRIEGSAYHRP